MNESICAACPYCGELLFFEPEPDDAAVEYVEDCHVCCRPIVVTVIYSARGSRVELRRENE